MLSLAHLPSNLSTILTSIKIQFECLSLTRQSIAKSSVSEQNRRLWVQFVESGSFSISGHPVALWKMPTESISLRRFRRQFRLLPKFPKLLKRSKIVVDKLLIGLYLTRRRFRMGGKFEFRDLAWTRSDELGLRESLWIEVRWVKLKRSLALSILLCIIEIAVEVFKSVTAAY